MSESAWRVAGAMALGHVALVLVGVTQLPLTGLDTSPNGVAQAYAEANMALAFTGGYAEAIGFLLLLPVFAFLAREVGRRTEAGGWAAQSAFAAGVCYVAVSFAPGLAAGAAALSGAQDGADAATVAVVNDVRNFAYLLSALLLAAHAIGFAVAALTDRVLPRWLGWAGIASGVVLLVSVPAASIDALQHDAVNIAVFLWLIWFVGLAVVLLRHRPADAQPGVGSEGSSSTPTLR